MKKEGKNRKKEKEKEKKRKIEKQIETKHPSGKPANCQPAGLPRGEMIPYMQANPRNYQLNRACRRNSPKTWITARFSHLKNFFQKNNFFLYFEKSIGKTIILKKSIGKQIILQKKYWKKNILKKNSEKKIF